MSNEPRYHCQRDVFARSKHQLAIGNYNPKPGIVAGLTERELEILDLIAQGQNNSTIAIKLSLSIKREQNYVSSIVTKLQLADRVQTIIRAGEAGFGKKVIKVTSSARVFAEHPVRSDLAEKIDRRSRSVGI